MGLASAAQLSTAISLNNAGCESRKSLMRIKSPGLFSARGSGHREPSATTVSTAEPGNTAVDQTVDPQPTSNIADELLGPPPAGQSTSPTAASPVETAAPNPAPSIRNAPPSLMAAAFMAAVFVSAVMLL